MKIARRRAPSFAVAAGILTLVALLLLVQSLRGAGGGLFALLATAAAIASVWQAAFDFAIARRNPTATLAAHSLAATLGFQLLLAEWLIARWFFPMSWVTPVCCSVWQLSCPTQLGADSSSQAVHNHPRKHML